MRDSGVLTDQCESAADMIRQGCTVCFNMTNPIQAPALDVFLNSNTTCDLMKTRPESCFTVVKGIDYDGDSDGDGENDSWSALFGYKTQRVRIYDVKEQ